MKSRFIISRFVLTPLFLISIVGCEREESIPFVEDPPPPIDPPVNLVSTDPASGSTIFVDKTITVKFDRTPEGVSASFGTVNENVGVNAISISGPFQPGKLTLVLTWTDGTQTLTYNVKGYEPNLVGSYILVQISDKLRADGQLLPRGWAIIHEPPDVSGTLELMERGTTYTFSIQMKLEKDGNVQRATGTWQATGSSVTFLTPKAPFNGDDFYGWSDDEEFIMYPKKPTTAQNDPRFGWVWKRR